MPESVFIETTIPSYYVAKRSRDIVQAARQELTLEWWDHHRLNYELLTSQVVLDEAGRGDAGMATLRLLMLEDLPLLVINEPVAYLAEQLIQGSVLPQKAVGDAFHIACAAVHRVDFILTWNCTHIANPHNWHRIRDCLARHKVEMPVICTPEEFIGDNYENRN